MTRPSRKWCAAIALLSLAISPEAGKASDSAAAGRSAAGSALGRFGSTEGIRQNATNPLTAGGQLQTIDGSQTGSVTLTNPSSTAFLTILVQPGGTGDLTTVQIAQDTDFNGQVDYSYSLPVRVSGVCADGIISCNAGTWLDCDAYGWTADSDGKVSASFLSAGTGGLGGCYCINASCGSNLPWNNLSLILKDLGGGVVGAVQKTKDRYVVTRVSLEGASISYYGQNTSTGGGSSPQTQYLGNPGALTSDAEDTTISQAGDPDSIYSAVLASFSQRGISQSQQTCSVQRAILVENNSYPVSVKGTGTTQTTVPDGWFGTYHRLEFNNELFRYCNTTWGCGGWVNLNGSGTSQSGQFAVAVSGHRMEARFWHGEIGWTYGGWASMLLGGTSSSWWSHSITISPTESGSTIKEGSGPDVALSACNPGDLVSPVTSSCVSCSTNESINNLCSSYENNPDCELQEEVVDGVTTYQHYNPTLLSPLPSARTYGDDLCATEFTRNWWRKDRTYFCKVENTFDMAEAGQRVDTITRSTLDNDPGNVIVYDDLRKDPDTGQWLAESGEIRLSDLPGVDDCRNVCKTRRPIQDTQAGPSGVATSYQSSSQAWEFFYKTCTDDGCPLESGEEVIKECQCINEFAEAASVMSVLDTASKDMICSDGNKK